MPGALVFCATILAYLPAVRGGFLWDDDAHVTKAELRSLHGLERIWGEAGATQQYYPLLHTAFWMEHRLWGDAVAGYHLTNILLHAAAACLVVAVVRRLFDQGRAQQVCAPTRGVAFDSRRGADLLRPSLSPGASVAWLAGLIFALHPVCVESVAWISEQKNTLSAVCYLGAVFVYLGFDRDRRASQYWLALGLFVLALLSKTVTATLPAGLLVVFWWQRGRLSWRRDALPLLPWFGLGITGGLFSAWVERVFIGAHGTNYALSSLDRCLLAGRVVWFYLGKLAWPADLIFIYPRWAVDAEVWWQWLFPLSALGLIGLLCWVAARRTGDPARERAARAPLAGWLFFVGTLFPALGFLNVYPFRYSYVADHFQYLASLGIIVPAASGLSWLLARTSAPAKSASWVLGAGLPALCAVLTWRQCGMYRDAEVFYRTTLARNPDCWLAHNNLGLAWSKLPGRLNDAIVQYQESLRVNPDCAEAHNNLGVAWSKLPGRRDDAISQYQEALRLMPGNAEAHHNLGKAWSQMPGRLNDAIAQYQEALRVKPDYAEAHNGLGAAFAELPGRLEDAISQYQEALRLQPDNAEAHNNLGVAWSHLPGRRDDAISQYQEALRLMPDFAEAHNNLGNAWSQLPGRLEDAISQYQEALRLMPGYVEAHYNLGVAWSHLPGRLKDAITQYREALRLDPDHASAWHNLGASLYELGDLPAAAAAFREELRLLPNDLATQQALSAVLQQAKGR